jgi:hypothetical protein
MIGEIETIANQTVSINAINQSVKVFQANIVQDN